MNAATARFQALSANATTVQPAQDFDAVETRSLLWALWHGRWKIAGLAFGVGFLVWIVMNQVTPTYTVYSKLMLDTRKAQIVGRDEVVADVDPSEQVVNSEIAVLRSNIVIEKMLAGLTPEQRDLIDPALHPKSITSRVKGVIKGLFAGEPTPPGNAEAALARETRLVDAVRGMRTAYALPDSYVMIVRVDATDPVLARDLANGLTDAYIALQLESRRSAVIRATTWLEEQLDGLRQQVETAESAVAQYRAESLIAEGGTLESVSQQLNDLNAELAAIRTARVEAESRLNQLVDVLGRQDVEAAAAVVVTLEMQELAAQRLKLRQYDAVWARTFDSKQSRRVKIQTELEEIRMAMLGELDAAIAAARSDVALAQNREAGIVAGIQGLERKVMSMTDNQLVLRQLNREADAARQTYESFLVRIAETRAQKELQQADSVLVESAMLPEVPSAPRPTLLATLAMTVMAALAAASVLLKEMAPATFRSTRELGAATGLPVLTALPDEAWPDTRDMLADLKVNPNSNYAERIRQLRAAVMLHRTPSDRGRSVLILAAAPGEGKTTTALALTQMAALSGLAAIIVDCDLRRPKVLKSLGGRMNLAHDFNDYIEYKCDLPAAICHPPECDFDVLAAQEPRRSGADALSVTWFGPVLRELERAYDLVIVDAPALLAVPDALIVAQEVETNFFLVSCDQTPRNVVQRGLATLGEMGIEVRGLILNKVDPRKFSDPFEGGYTYGYRFAGKTWRGGNAPKEIWIGDSSGSARGNHPLLAGRDAWWRKGT